GVGVFGPTNRCWVHRLVLPGNHPRWVAAQQTLDRLGGQGHILKHEHDGAYVRLEMKETLPTAEAVENWLAEKLPGCEIVSLGRRLEIPKQIGSPARLEPDHGASHLGGRPGPRPP